MRVRYTALVLLAVVAALPRPAHGIITFTELDEGVFTVSHRIKIVGSRGRATKLVYTKAASLCIAAGYTHYQVLNQESDAGQEYESANATVRVRFFQSGADDRLGCERSADPQYIEEARAKLLKRGYVPPAPEAAQPAAGAAPAGEGGTPTGTCTLEQIAAMARTGLSDEKIRAACQ